MPPPLSRKPRRMAPAICFRRLRDERHILMETRFSWREFRHIRPVPLYIAAVLSENPMAMIRTLTLNIRDYTDPVTLAADTDMRAVMSPSGLQVAARAHHRLKPRSRSRTRKRSLDHYGCSLAQSSRGSTDRPVIAAFPSAMCRSADPGPRPRHLSSRSRGRRRAARSHAFRAGRYPRSTYSFRRFPSPDRG